MFVEEKDTQTKVRHVTCHELTHACSAFLILPAWLNEGLAAVTVDRYLGKQTIHPDTRELVRSFTPKAKPPTYREMSHLRGKALAYHAVRGYWLVRYLEENHPGFLKQHLVSPQTVAGIEAKVAALLGLAPEDFWSKIDDIIGSLRDEHTASVQAD
jgi:hypothetical protein